MNESRRWHVTHAASNKSPMVWKLEGNQAIAFGFSIGLALFLFQVLISTFSWSSLTAITAAGLLPAATLFVLLSLVRGKPRGHLRRWVEWQVLNARSEELMVERTSPLGKPGKAEPALRRHKETPTQSTR